MKSEYTFKRVMNMKIIDSTVWWLSIILQGVGKGKCQVYISQVTV